jgi:hypothetical protein
MVAEITSCPMAVTVNLWEQPSLGILWGQITLVIGDQDVLVTAVNAHFNFAYVLGMHDDLSILMGEKRRTTQAAA